MAIPDFQSVMLPLLRVGGDNLEHSVRDATTHISDEFGLTQQEREALLESGNQTIILNRVSWACSYLKKAGLLEASRRGYFRITKRGLETLATNPPRIDVRFLTQFTSFAEFRAAARQSGKQESPPPPEIERSPEEEIEVIYGQIRNNLASEILATLKKTSPERFERLVVDLLVKMGYGGTRRDAGQAIGRSGDGGIDGIIKEDRLGLDAIYIQAKRWDDANGVGRPEIQKFAGALQGHRARKGVFLTTSYFTRDAQEFVNRIDSKIVLIDGDMIGQLMIDYGLGVSTIATYDVKRIDSDYFSDEV